MTEEDLLTLVQDERNPAHWIALKPGSFNYAYRSTQIFTYAGFTGRWVLKVPKIIEPTFEDDDTPEDRAVKVKHAQFYNACNDASRAERKWTKLDGLPFVRMGKRYLVPDLGSLEASDPESAFEAIDTYLKHREIVVDLCGHGNCLNLGDRRRIVDVGYMMRRGSILSDQYYADEDLQFNLDQYLAKWYVHKPLTVGVIWVLRYLERNLTQREVKDEYITPEIISILYNFWRAGEVLTSQVMDVLVQVTKLNSRQLIEAVDLTPELIKRLCEMQGVLTCEQLFLSFFKGYFPGIENQSVARYRGYTLLHIAVLMRDTTWFEKLLSSGFDINSAVTGHHTHPHVDMSALELAVIESTEAFALTCYQRSRLRLSAESANQVFLRAAGRGYVNLMRQVAGDDNAAVFEVDDEDYNALHIAARAGHISVAELLVAQGISLEAKTAHGQTALDIAVELEQEAMIALLVRAGARPSRQLSAMGQTILHICAKPELASIMTLLLQPYEDCKKHADAWRHSIFSPIAAPVIQMAWRPNLLPLDVCDPMGRTALSYAAGSGCNRLIELLFKCGAKLNYAGKRKALYPLDAAYASGHAETAAYLETLGAVRNPHLVPKRKRTDSEVAQVVNP